MVKEQGFFIVIKNNFDKTSEVSTEVVKGEWAFLKNMYIEDKLGVVIYGAVTR